MSASQTLARPKRRYRWIPQTELREIKQALADGLDATTVARMHDRDPSHMRKIRAGKIHKQGGARE